VLKFATFVKIPVMTVKEILLAQFAAAYDLNGWFVALKNAIEGLNAAQAVWKTENIDNSIWEILSHLNYYNYAYLERFKGVNYVYPANNNEATFISEISEEEWQVETEKLNFVMKEWRNLLESADETKFDQPVSKSN
jgi:DinB superfamily